MHDRNRFTDIALGLGIGVALALLFLVWAVPEFRNPDYSGRQESAQPQQSESAAQQEYPDEQGWWYWTTHLAPLEDTLAQWIMAISAILATAFTILAVTWASRAVRTSEAQARAYLSCTGAKFAVAGQMCRLNINFKNNGQSPARRVEVGGTVIVPKVNSGNENDIFLRSNPKTFELFEITATMEDDGFLMFSLPFGADVCRDIISKELVLGVECRAYWLDVFGKWQTIDFYLTETESEIITSSGHGIRREGSMKATNAKPTQPDRS